MDVIHGTYLPFTGEQLLCHFAPVASGGDPQRHLRYYLDSAKAWSDYSSNPPTNPLSQRQAEQRARQMEKDERFWIAAALLGLHYSSDPTARLVELLRRCFGDKPPVEGVATWEAALGPEQHIYFEVNLPSPKSYNKWLEAHLDSRVIVPYLRERARTARPLEGATKADAMLIAPSTGFAVLFEAKVLSDLSTQITFDMLRNQLARNIDVTLDRQPTLQAPLNLRLPKRTCVVLVTPEIFERHRDARLYGLLYDRYKHNPDVLAEHLPHRTDTELAGIGRRLGWLTWEDFNRVLPDTCPWLLSRRPD